MVGKWHLCPDAEMNLASSRRNWPTGRGFERFYGFLGAETNQWYPELVYDSHPVDPPRTPEEGYHFGEDITDKALEFIKDAKVLAPDKPFFLYYAPGACHAPHHAPKEWIDRFKGRFDMGYEAIREQTLARQKQMGIVPPEHRAAADQPDRHAGDAHRARTASRSRRWTTRGRGTRCRRTSSGCSAGWRRSTPASWRTPTSRSGGCWTTWRRRASARTRSWCWSPTTAPAARAARTDRSTRTSCSTASPTTSPRTWRCSTSSAARRPTTTTPTAGRWRSTRRSRCGSATSTPAAPLTRASSPGRRASRPRASSASSTTTRSTSSRRSSTCSASRRPRRSAGTCRAASTASACATASTPPRLPSARATQFYSMLGSRSIWHDGWTAVTNHPTISGWGNFDKDTWELYHTDVDRSELHDLGEQEPERLREMVNLWYAEAGANGAFPLDDRGALEIILTPRPVLSPARNRYVYYPGRGRRARVASGQRPQPLLRDRRGRRHPGGRGRGRAVRARLALRRPRPLRQGQPAALRLQLRRRARAEDRRRAGAADRRAAHPLGRVREGRRGPARRGGRHALALPRRRQGRRGPHQDPAGQVLARRRRPVRRARQQRPRHRATTPAPRRTGSPAARSTASPSTSAASPTSTSSAKPSP